MDTEAISGYPFFTDLLSRDGKGVHMAEEYKSSTLIDTEFDVIDELNGAVTDLEKALGKNKELFDKTDYIKFLIKELDDALSGDYTALRRRRFITKRSK
jgi:hypothetical protein